MEVTDLILDKLRHTSLQLGEPNFRSKRSPTDNDPEKFEAMIIDENGKFIHLQWMKAQQTLFNEHLPIWTAHLKNWGTHHEMRPDLSHKIGDFVAYHDLEQNSAVLYNKRVKKLWGSIGTKYYILGLPINLLHQCYKVGGTFLRISPHVSHRVTDHIEPTNEVISRFENCDDRSPLSSITPSSSLSSKSPHISEDSDSKKNKKVDKREINLIYNNITKIRKRRENPEHFYFEILLFIRNEIVHYDGNSNPDYRLMSVLIFHLIYFNSIDMLYAKLKINDIHIHINLAGIIIEDDAEAFDEVIDYIRYKKSPHIDKLYHLRFLRYLEYYNLPFQKDSVDMIFITTGHEIMYNDYAGVVDGLTWNEMDRYRTRQMYNHIDEIPLSISKFTQKVYEYCAGAHEIAHALTVPHDPTNVELTKNGQCYGLMQEHAPFCFNCMNWSPESIDHLQKFTLYGILGQCLLQVPAGDCGKRLQCKSPYKNPDSSNLSNLLILPLDGTPYAG
ncbi:hypothetical protein PV327_003416 [Microctonus hyperodae]|uniref:Uncharacterized protein n=1 Tax=Microctonus hyperodae TaxID=165561 RepID=A0AA39L116_MICHY|nr:hypothetical protein PV327_003416 [Microctonus hyperodae]